MSLNVSENKTLHQIRSRGSLAVVAGMKKPNDHAEPSKVERLLKIQKNQMCINVQVFVFLLSRAIERTLNY